MLNLRTQRLLEQQHVPYEVMGHRVAFTAHGTAAAAHVPGQQFAKVLVVQATPGHPHMVVLSANCHLDLEAVAEAAGEGPLALVDEVSLAHLFPDCEIGAMPPFGNLYGMPVLVSACVAHGRDLVFNAGTHREVVRMRYADFEQLVHPRVVEICRSPRGSCAPAPTAQRTNRVGAAAGQAANARFRA
jgi:Ala-tRNA(Pro) deacylase